MTVDLSPYQAQFPDREQQINNAKQAVAAIDAMVITSEQQYRDVGAMLVQCQAIGKQYDDQRKRITTPIRVALNEVNGWFKPVIDLYEQAGRGLKQRLIDYQARAAAEKARLAAAAQQAHEAGDTAGVLATVATAQAIAPPPLPGVAAVKRWCWRVTNHDAIPRRWLKTDDTAINEAMREAIRQGSIPEIPGLEFYQETSIAASRGSR